MQLEPRLLHLSHWKSYDVGSPDHTPVLALSV
jgi:hypothetical protein